MIDLICGRFAYQLDYLRDLIADIPESRLAEQPAPGMNSPAWILGHLAWAADLIPVLLGQASMLDDGWAERFGATSCPSPDATLYPSKSDLFATLEAAHTRALAALPLITPEILASEQPAAEFRFFLPTVGDAIVQIMTTHEAGHAGQLSAWRRAAGMPPTSKMFFA